MISDEELEVLYQETFSECATLEDEIKMFKSLTGEHRDSLRKMYCNGLLYMISQGYVRVDLYARKQVVFVTTCLSLSTMN